MSQVLIQSDGQKQLVDRAFVETALPPVFSVHAGQKVMIDHGQDGKPVIRQKGKTFFYESGEPVTKEADVSHLPEPYRGQALAFIRDQQEKPPVVHRRKRGRPPQPKLEKAGVKKAGVKITRVAFKAEDALGAEALRPAKAE